MTNIQTQRTIAGLFVGIVLVNLTSIYKVRASRLANEQRSKETQRFILGHVERVNKEYEEFKARMELEDTLNSYKPEHYTELEAYQYLTMWEREGY